MNRSISRREMLRLSGAGLVGLGLWPRQIFAEPTASDEFSFIAVNDLHYLQPACRPWFDRVVRQMKVSAPKAEFCLLGGDLADNGTIEQLTGIRDAFVNLGIPVYAVIGNHDHLTDTDRSAYEKIFPEQINYHFEHGGLAGDRTRLERWNEIPGNNCQRRHTALAGLQPAEVGYAETDHGVHPFPVR